MASGRCQSAGNVPGRSARSLDSHALSPPIHSPILLNSLGFAQNLCVLCVLCVSKKQSSRAVVSPSHGEAPAEPHPCHKRRTDPCRSTKTPTIAHSAHQRAMARQEPRPPTPSPACSQDSTESPRHWASVYRRNKLLTESPVPERHPARPSNALNSSRSVLRIVLPNGLVFQMAGDLDSDR